MVLEVGEHGRPVCGADRTPEADQVNPAEQRPLPDVGEGRGERQFTSEGSDFGDRESGVESDNAVGVDTELAPGPCRGADDTSSLTRAGIADAPSTRPMNGSGSSSSSGT